MKESVLQVIHNLAHIKKQINHLSLIEKDILLQEIRQLYVSIMEIETVETTTDSTENIETQNIVKVVETLTAEVAEQQASAETEFAGEESEVDFEEAEEEMLTPEFTISEETDLDFIEEEFHEDYDSQTENIKIEEETADNVSFNQMVGEEENNENIPETAIEEATPTDVEVGLADDLLQFLPKEMTAEKTNEEKVAEFNASLFPEDNTPAETVEINAAPAVEPAKVAEPQPSTEPKKRSENNSVQTQQKENTPTETVAKKTAPAVEPAKVAEPQPSTEPKKRSLNDLLQAQHEENSLFNKMQQSKINDLLKAISLNDKFLFIKELFNGKGEDFSFSIQKLNNCANLDEAFEELESMKKHYFWESTSTAYLSLCDLIRRRYINQ